MDISVRVVHNNVQQYANYLGPAMDDVIARAALSIQASAQMRAPVDTGNLKGSIRAVRNGLCDWTVIVGAEYGLYVEFGTRFMAAQPYLNPAADAAEEPLRRALQRVITSGPT